MPVNKSLLQSQRTGQPSRDRSVPAPVGGWNTRDARSAMKSIDALVLDNIVPGVGQLYGRQGSASHATSLADEVETIMEFHYGTTRQMISASGSKLYDTTSAGAASEIGTGYTNARWQYVKFGSTIPYLWMCNGADTPIYYDGSTITATSLSGDVTATSVVDVHAFKNRLYLVENDSGDFYYGGVNAVTGAFTRFSLSRIAKNGGNLMTIKSITRDGGNGSDDLIAFFMTTGEVIIYQGSDPGDADNWSLVGRYNMPPPVNRRAFIEYGGDVLIITHSDLVKLTEVIKLIKPSKLSGAVRDAVSAYGSNYGWQATYYPNGNMILFNIPIVTDSEYHQYGFNTITGATFRFKGWNARCFGVFNNELYFGGSTKVIKADTGYDDEGADIVITAQAAFNDFRDPKRKHFTLVRPITEIDGNVSVNIGLAFDYADVAVSQDTATVSVGDAWDVAEWDNAQWAPEATTHRETRSASGTGQSVSIKVVASLNNQSFKWYSTDFKYKPLARFT